MYEDKPVENEYKAITDLRVYEFERAKLVDFLIDNPGIIMNILFSKQDKCI